MRQDQALHIMLSGKSVFLTGPAGSGKTYVLNKLIRQLKKQGSEVAVTASTGIAATHLGGTTIHSWSGLGIREEVTNTDKVWLADNARLRKRYNMTDVLIIDEASMLHGKRLDMINEVAKLLRDSPEPFGGMQVILTGDLFQLPPINRGREPDDFVHASRAWQELDPAICYLTSQHRQNDGALLGLLNALRTDTFDEFHAETLQERVGMKPDESEVVLTRLYTHNVNVDTINDQQLAALPGEVEVYEMDTTGRKQSVEQLQKSVLAPERLELKIGAEVMFVANNFAAGFANGTRGQVIDFDGDWPRVRLQANNKIITVEPHSWRYEEDGRERGSVSQLPLRLAWAITIHKSQGMSLDSALIDLSRAFTYGMGYVALSRVRSIDGLYLSGINDMALRLHPQIFAFDAHLRTASLALAEEIGEVPVPVVVEKAADEQPIANPNRELFEALRRWRAGRASSDSLPAYIIAHDKTLDEISRRLPRSEAQLLAINGFGVNKVAKYGPDILKITQDFTN
ncbi:MAG: AAA family ATPase [Candidatus Saccharimonadales bacterium]